LVKRTTLRAALALATLLAVALPAAAAIPAAERQALIDLYNATGGASWADNTGWLGAAGTECSWHGVLCDVGETTVTQVSLFHNNLVGTIPASIGDLTGLQFLDFETNQLTGPIPPELGNLSSLVRLYLDVNQLTGPIPPELGNLSNLQELYLQSNQVLAGPIPASLGNLTALTYLNLGDNQLTGPIPPELGNLTQLTFLSLHSNQLSGALPASIGNLVNLQRLFVDSNKIIGVIPDSLLNLVNLQTGMLDLRWNGLWTANTTLDAFLASKQMGGDWAGTQTIAPTGVGAAGASATSVMVSWTPIAYTADAGGYRVSYATVSGGPYTFFARTADKTAISLEVTGLAPATTYYFIVESETDPHGGQQQNTVTSEPSPEVSATAPAATPTPTPTGTPPPSPTPTPAAGPTIVTSSPLPAGQAGVPYSMTFAATGGLQPYSWAVIGGAPPPVLGLNATTGELSGTPSSAGHWSFTVEVTDIRGVNDSKLFDIDIVGQLQPIPTLGRTGFGVLILLLSIVAIVMVRKMVR